MQAAHDGASSRAPHIMPKRGRDARTLVAVLLPDEPPAAVLASLPKDDPAFELLLIAKDDALASPALAEVRALVHVPGASIERLTALVEGMPALEWVHSMLAGVDKLGGLIKSHLAGSPIVLTNARGAYSSSLAAQPPRHARVYYKAVAVVGDDAPEGVGWRPPMLFQPRPACWWPALSTDPGDRPKRNIYRQKCYEKANQLLFAFLVYLYFRMGN